MNINYFKREIKIRVCPRCRGHELERLWCDLCKGSGLLKL